MPDRIARFEILEKIGEGGMAVVYKARDPQMGRIVAIKLLKEGFNSSEMRDRFIQEARSAARLQHPSIVTVFDLDEQHQPPLIVMEFLAGDPLDRVIKSRTPISLMRKLELIEALCAGLAYAHDRRVVHRDIKPANLMVMPDAMLKILDFGIAQAGESDRPKIGGPIGTFNYMPPEQVRGDGVDARSDIFAVGAVFYEFVSYAKAFPGRQTEAITRVMTSEPEPLARRCPGLEPEIEVIIARALEKNPSERYQDLTDMRGDIVRVRERLQRR